MSNKNEPIAAAPSALENLAAELDSLLDPSNYDETEHATCHEGALLKADVRESVNQLPLNPIDGETHEEKSRRLMLTFVEGAVHGHVPPDLIRWVGRAFGRFLQGEMPNLNDAFRVSDPRLHKAQIGERKRIEIVNAYENAISFHTCKFEIDETGRRVASQEPLTRSTLVAAEQAAWSAYYDGAKIEPHLDWERDFKKTVRKYLEQAGVYVRRSDPRVYKK
jgi:hypothetical protein